MLVVLRIFRSGEVPFLYASFFFFFFFFFSFFPFFFMLLHYRLSPSMFLVFVWLFLRTICLYFFSKYAGYLCTLALLSFLRNSRSFRIVPLCFCLSLRLTHLSSSSGCNVNNCDACQPLSPHSCLNCTSGFYALRRRIRGKAKCVRQCPTGYTADLTNDGIRVCKSHYTGK